MAFTQKEQILRYLRRYKAIDPAKAFYSLGITKLSTRISELKREGHKIIDEWHPVKTRNNKRTRVKRYRLAA